jgi:hypothetical protein
MSRPKLQHSPEEIREFFAWSNWLDSFVLRPLAHIAPYWEASWDHDEKRYRPEPHSFAADLNTLIDLLATQPRPNSYHDHEDNLAERVIRDLKWPIQKKDGRWIGADYGSILEQGAFDDLNQQNLLSAAAGRIHAAIDYGQRHFDDMEEGHLNILAALLSITLYHRHCDGSFVIDERENTD